MRRIVITGGTGLLGAHVVPLLRQQAELHLLGRIAPGVQGVEHHRVDLSRGLASAALPAEVDAVIHMAQSRRFREFPGGAGDVAAVNVQATVELAQYAALAGARRFIFLSTGGIYARSDEPLTEAAPGAPAGFYASSKYAAERLLEPFGAVLDVIVLRPFFIYGRGQDRSMLIPRLVDQVRVGNPIRLAGAEGMRINPIHASDAARAVGAALELQGSHTINLAGREVVSLRAIGEMIGTMVGKPPTFDIGQKEKDGDLVASIDTMSRLLVPPVVPLAHGLQDLL